jgi:hypothetical protein
MHDDKFAEPTVRREAIGRTFSFHVSLEDGEVHRTGVSRPYFTYKDGTLRLIFGLNGKYAGQGISGPKFMTGEIGGKVIPGYSYRGSNAFGARANVKVTQLQQNTIAFVNAPRAEMSPYRVYDDFDRRMGITPKLDTYWTELKLSGPAARALSTDATLVIEGSIAPIKDGMPTYCTSIYGAATVSSPNEIYGSNCWVGAIVTRVAFVRKSSGDVIKEWK